MNNKIFILTFFLFIALFSLYSCSPNQQGKNKTKNKFSLEKTLVIGQKYYHLRGCIKCHGRTGEGDGYKSLYLPPDQAPLDFKEFTNYKQGHDLESIIFTIRNGITNKPPVTRKSLMKLFSTNIASSSGMPAYPHLTDEEISYIAHYVLYLQTNQY